MRDNNRGVYGFHQFIEQLQNDSKRVVLMMCRCIITSLKGWDALGKFCLILSVRSMDNSMLEQETVILWCVMSLIVHQLLHLLTLLK